MRRLLLLLLASTLLAATATATSVLYLTDVEQAKLSDAVVRGTVASQRVEAHPRWKRPVTISTIRVAETLFGASPPTVDVHQLKGTLDGKELVLPGSMELRTGEDVVLFLHQVEGTWYPTALEQSKYVVTSSRLGARLTRPPLTADLYRQSADGGLVPTDEPARKPLLLDELRRSLRALAGNR